MYTMSTLQVDTLFVNANVVDVFTAGIHTLNVGEKDGLFVGFGKQNYGDMMLNSNKKNTPKKPVKAFKLSKILTYVFFGGLDLIDHPAFSSSIASGIPHFIRLRRVA